VIDLHLHTSRCGHAEGTLEEYAAAARVSGITTIAFTDHLPLPADLLASDPHAAQYAMPESDLDAYVAEVLALRSASISGGGPEILLGVEADLHPGNEAHVRRLLDLHPFDVVLGSVHFVDGWAFDDPDRRDGYHDWDARALWERYFDDLIAAARTGLADVIGHADLVKKFGCVPAGDLAPLYERVAAACAQANVVVEVNTAGLRKPCNELYPSAAFLSALREADVRVTTGSDAHRAAEVGAGFAEARSALIAAGYDRVSLFHNRIAEEVAL
jgi:histidinol-phosphatase (PHP family)